MDQTIPLGHIRIDGGTQFRIETDQRVVQDYADALGRGVAFPPVDVVFDAQEQAYWLVDGYHRLHAHKLAERTEIACQVSHGDIHKARLLACRANSNHGLQRSNATKRNVVREALGNPECQGWSNAKIADWCSVSAPFVAGIRQAMSMIPSEVQGKNGKTYKLAERLTEAHVYACPSLAQAEAWRRQHAGHKTLDELLCRYIVHLQGIEAAPIAAALVRCLTYSFENIAAKGPGLLRALALRLQVLATAERPDDWADLLDSATKSDSVFELACCADLELDQREKALRAWLQWRDWNVAFKVEEAVTPALERHWREKHAPKPSVVAKEPVTAERIEKMSKAELISLMATHSWKQEPKLFHAVCARVQEVAPEIMVTCPDPICLGQRYLLVDAWARCPICRRAVETSRAYMADEAHNVDVRRRAEQGPLSLVLELLAKPESEWSREDGELFWDRVAVWRDQGCQGLPEAGDDEAGDDEGGDEEDAA